MSILNMDLSELELREVSQTDIYHENHPLHHLVMQEELKVDEANENYLWSDKYQKDMQELIR